MAPWSHDHLTVSTRSDQDLSFGVPLPDPPGTVHSDEPLTLSSEVQAEVNAQLEDIRRAHAAAIANAHKVVVWR